jgi:hypothetical protein
MTILLGIRLLSRFRRFGGRLGLDDVFISLAWVISTGNAAATLLGKVTLRSSKGCQLREPRGCYKYGVDRHIWDVPPELWPKAVLVCSLQ